MKFQTVIFSIKQSNTTWIKTCLCAYKSYTAQMTWMTIDDFFKSWAKPSQVRVKSQKHSSHSLAAARLIQVVTYDLTWWIIFCHSCLLYTHDLLNLISKIVIFPFRKTIPCYVIWAAPQSIVQVWIALSNDRYREYNNTLTCWQTWFD